MARNEALGEFEQSVLLAIAHLQRNAYGVTIRREIEKRTGRRRQRRSLVHGARPPRAKGLSAVCPVRPDAAARWPLQTCGDAHRGWRGGASAVARSDGSHVGRPEASLSEDTDMTTPRPPRVASWIVSASLAADERDAVMGDLQEEFAVLAAERSAAEARRWYWKQTVLSVAPNLSRRAARPSLSAHAQRGGSVDSILQDVRYGWRMICRHPVVTSVAVMSLLVGIGLAAVVFSLLNAVLLRPLRGGQPGSARRDAEPEARQRQPQLCLSRLCRSARPTARLHGHGGVQPRRGDAPAGHRIGGRRRGARVRQLLLDPGRPHAVWPAAG